MAYAVPLVPFINEREAEPRNGGRGRNLRMTTGAAQLAGTAAPAQTRTLERNQS
jgi:hypothetical protein